MMSDRFQFQDLAGKTLLITGVTRGIGRALLRGFLDQGLRIVAVSQGMPLMRLIREELGADESRMACFDCDLANPDEVERLGRELLGSGVPIDAILHNAAIDPRQAFEQSDDAFWPRVFQVNVFAAVTLTRMLLPVLRESGRGRILFMGSVVFEIGAANLAAYTASKGAIVGVMRSLSHELKGSGITVNCIAPGAIRVEKEALNTAADLQLIDWQAISRRLVPEDLLGLICLLLSQAGGGITGQTLSVDGGLLHPLADPSVQKVKAAET